MEKHGVKSCHGKSWKMGEKNKVMEIQKGHVVERIGAQNRPFQKCITQVSSLIITEVINQRVTRCSGQARFYGENVNFGGA